MPDDAVGRLGAGDRQSLAELYDRYSGIAFSLAVRPLGPQAAEEAVQDAFLRVWRNIKGFDPERGSFQRWFLAIVRNCVIDELRRRRAAAPRAGAEETEILFRALPDRAPGPEEQVWHQEVGRRLAAALAHLPVEQRAVLVLAYYGGYSQSEIADRLGLPLGTVKKRVKLGMDKLRGALAGEKGADLV